MHLCNFHADEGIHLGILTPKGVIDTTLAEEAFFDFDLPTSLEAVLQNPHKSQQIFGSFVPAAMQVIDKILAMGDDDGSMPNWLLPENTLRFAPAVLQPQKIICVGKNYRDHAAEMGSNVPRFPILFSKFNNALAAHDEAIPLSNKAIKYDYEGELAVIMGKRVKSVQPQEALNYVFGYSIGNDLSARDLQKATSQWLLGKSLDKFLPIGPYIVTNDAIADPQNLGIRTWVNGDLRQDSNTQHMIFSVAQIVSFISQVMTLLPGDIIMTGTPSGVIAGMDNPQWLKPDDEVVVEIEQIGRLANVMQQGTTHRLGTTQLV